MLPNAQYDLANNVLAIPTAEHKLLVVDRDTLDKLVYDVDTHTIDFNDRRNDLAQSKTIKLKSMDVTLVFDESGDLCSAHGNVLRPGDACDYNHYYPTEVTCNKHNKTRLRQLLKCKHRHASDRRISRNQTRLFNQALNELGS